MKNVLNILILTVLSMSCSSNTGNNEESKQEHIGKYKLSSLTMKTDNNPEVDFLIFGSMEVAIELKEDFTLAGEAKMTLFEENEDNDAVKLTGTYTRNGDEISLNVDQDFFIKDEKWTYSKNQLISVNTEIEGGVTTTKTTIFKQQ